MVIRHNCYAQYFARHSDALIWWSYDKAYCWWLEKQLRRSQATHVSGQEEGSMEMNRPGAEIIEEFKKKRTRQIMAVGPIILAFIALLSVESNPTGIFGLPPNIVLGLSFALIISVLIFSLFNWRCPSCNKYLGKAMNPKFCSRCGIQLR